MHSFPFPYVLSIAGHDPCAGAGLTSDIKTFDHHAVYGLSVVTAITIQNDIEFKRVQWVDLDLMIDQINMLFKSYLIKVVKIGLIEDFMALKQLIQHLKNLNQEIKIIWDPILQSSSGFDFHDCNQMDNEVFQDIYLITPNAKEFEIIKQQVTDIKKINYLLKGGHLQENKGTDILWHAGVELTIEGKSFDGKSKHGTGCVLSSAIASNLAKGKDLKNSCILAKKYVEKFILSTDENLGIHQF